MSDTSNIEPSKNLLLLTFEYPYGTGETFLETEIPFLVKQFRRVLILPAFPGGAVRALPSGTELIDSRKSNRGNFREFVTGLVRSDGFVFREWRNSPRFPLSPLLFYRITRTLGIARLIEKQILDTVSEFKLNKGLIYSYWLNQSALGAIFAAKKLRWPVISRVHGGDLYTERYYGNYLPFQEYKLANVDCVFPVSEAGKNYIKSRYNYLNVNMRVSRLGVDDFGIIKHKPGSDKVFHIASCSAVYPLKRVDLILETAVSLAQKMPGKIVRWSHIGEGTHFKKLEKRVANTSVPNLEIHLAGELKNRDIVPYYINSNVDLFINFSTSEGLPVSIMEAISCGIPVAAPDIGGISEIVNSKNGILFTADAEPTQVSEFIYDDINQNSLLEKSLKARETWHNLYNRTDNFTKFAHTISSF